MINSKNLIRFDEWESPFSDAFSQFSLGFSDNNLGSNFIHPKAALATYEMCSPLLHLWQRTGEGVSIVRRTAMESLPWCVREEAELFVEGQRIEIQGETLFVDSRRARIRHSFINTDAQPVTLDLIWAGCIRPDTEGRWAMDSFKSAKPGKRMVVCEATDLGILFGLKPDPDTSDLPCLLFRLNAPKLSLRTTDSPPWGGTHPVSGAGFYELSTGKIPALASGESWSIEFDLQFRGANVSQPLDPWDDTDPDDWGTLFRRSEDRYTDASELRNLSPGQTHVLRARSAILCSGVRGHNGEFGDRVASLCSGGTQDFSCSFFWDTFFTSTALSHYNPSFARDAITTAFVRQNDFDGAAPERKWNYSCPQHSLIGCPQSPIGSWALNHYLDANDTEADLGFAKEVFPMLENNHRFWQHHSDADGDGLSEYNWSGQIGDNSQMWDPVSKTDPDSVSGCFWLPPVASATCNSFLYRDARELARLCIRLGEEEQAKGWTARADQIAARMKEILWVEEEQAYLDYNHRTREHHRVETFFQFLPLWAEVPMPDEAKRRLIEDKLLNPEMYFGAIPFPSAPYNSPDYEAGGYWRGRAWSHFSCWLTTLLWREGYTTEADEAARRIMAWQERWDFRENMHSDPAIFEPKGFRYYSWGSAAYLFLTEKLYQKENS